MIKGAAFDGSRINTLDVRNSNIMATGHMRNLEDDYKLLRDDGFEFFRDSCYLNFPSSGTGSNAHWDYIDRLARLSNGQIQLVISHYDWPLNIQALTAFCYQLARYYPGVFHSYIPAVEVGLWAQQCGTGQWLPNCDGWWSAYHAIFPILLHGAEALKAGDPTCKIAMSEPWGVHNMSWEDQARPFNNLMGKFDKVAFANKMYIHDDRVALLDIVGLNIYDWPVFPGQINEWLCIAKQMFPNKEIMVSETGNIWHQHIPPQEWWEMMENETRNTDVDTVVWSPAIQMYANLGHDVGKPIGGYLYDLNRKRINT